MDSTLLTTAARALGDAFASVAERVKPAVVSIHSTKTVKLRRFDLRLPFGDDSPLREFFNDDNSGNPFRQKLFLTVCLKLQNKLQRLARGKWPFMRSTCFVIR